MNNTVTYGTVNNKHSYQVLFDIFLRKLSEQSKKNPSTGTAASVSSPLGPLLDPDGFISKAADHSSGGLLVELVAVSREFAWLAGGGLFIGLAFGFLTT